MAYFMNNSHVISLVNLFHYDSGSWRAALNLFNMSTVTTEYACHVGVHEMGVCTLGVHKSWLVFSDKNINI
jgi:hypothetical protein